MQYELLKQLPIYERRHFMKCECGVYFDMRKTDDVEKHLHKNQARNARNSRIYFPEQSK